MVPLVALHDSETNGLLRPQRNKTLATKIHSIGIVFSDGRIICADPRGAKRRHTGPMVLPSGRRLEGVLFCTHREALEELAKADIRVGHNSQDFDERIYHKFEPWWDPKPGSRCMDTLILSKTLYPSIGRTGPNTHKCPPRLRMRHSVEGWGYRLGEKKDKDFDPGDWQTWTPAMSEYMMQDVFTLEKIWKWLMSRKPDPRSVDIEHDFAAIMRRQESWGFTFDRDSALQLQDRLHTRIGELEEELTDAYGSWWEPSPVQNVRASRRVKLTGFPDVTVPRWGKTGKRLADYVGPPLCSYELGSPFTPVEYVQFKPSSREHVRKMLFKRHGWVPTKYTEKGTPQIDDDVLRGLPFEEAPKLADYYAATKILGYVSTGQNNWLDLAVEEADGWRVHGSVNTIGTGSFRCSHSGPNMGQVPTRSEEFGHLCRALWIARKRFRLAGFDGSSLQLRLLAHYLWKWDQGAYAKVVNEGDPHAFIRDLVGTDLMGEEAVGRGRGKTLNYTIVFGGGDGAIGRVIRPHGSDGEKIKLGRMVKERAAGLFGPLEALKDSLRGYVENTHSLPGLDGSVAHVGKPHTALAFLLQMAEGKVMKKALVIFDRKLQAAGMRPGVGPDGVARPREADYEFCANVHDEGQADILPRWEETYRRLALEALPEAGIALGVKCPLKAEVKIGNSWADTH